MAEQEALLPDAGGIWARYRTAGQIDHAAWLRARAEGLPVGTCRHCHAHLHPEAPHDRGGGRHDYEATCHTPRCGPPMLAPGGRIYPGGTTAWSRTGGAARAAAINRTRKEHTT